MQEQNYANHTKFVTGFHKILFPAAMAAAIGSCVNLFHSLGDHERLYSAALLVVVSWVLVGTMFFARTFALGAQDRVIRLEERLRHQQLTGKPLDSRLTMRQIVALRFASDAEFPALAAKAAAESTAPKDIKQAIKNWKADHDRL
jgi:hypothetical protein